MNASVLYDTSEFDTYFHVFIQETMMKAEIILCGPRLTQVKDLTLQANIQSTLIISNSKGPSEILRDIRTSTYQICRI